MAVSRLLLAGLLAVQVPAVSIRGASNDDGDRGINPISALLHAFAPSDDAAESRTGAAMLKAVPAESQNSTESPLLQALRKKVTETSSADESADSAGAGSGARLMSVAKGAAKVTDDGDKKVWEEPAVAVGHDADAGGAEEEEPAAVGRVHEEAPASDIATAENAKEADIEDSPLGNAMAQAATAETDSDVASAANDAMDEVTEVHTDAGAEDIAAAQDSADAGRDGGAGAVASGVTDTEVHAEAGAERSVAVHDSRGVLRDGDADGAASVHTEERAETSAAGQSSRDVARSSDAADSTREATSQNAEVHANPAEDSEARRGSGNAERDDDTANAASSAKAHGSKAHVRTGSLDNSTARDSSRVDHKGASEHAGRDSIRGNVTVHVDTEGNATANHSDRAAHVRKAANSTRDASAAVRTEVSSQSHSAANRSSGAHHVDKAAHGSTTARAHASDNSKENSKSNGSQVSNWADVAGAAASAEQRSRAAGRGASSTSGRNRDNASISASVDRVVQNVLDEQDIETEQDAGASDQEKADTHRAAADASDNSSSEAVTQEDETQRGDMKDESEGGGSSRFSFAKRWVESHKVQTASEARKKANEDAKEIAERKAEEEYKRREIEAERSRTCDPIASAECSTMCRWLKLNDKDGDDCPLFDWQLRACQYAMPDQRPASSAPGPLDCAVNLTRTYVLKADVPSYMKQLDTCIQRVPQELNATCSMAIGLVLGEVKDWREETGYKKDSEVLHAELEAACEQGRAALESKDGEQSAIDRLSEGLSKAESVPGHYLVDEVHKARRMLDRLGPIPVARAQLRVALEDGRHAFETTELFKVKEAIAWLRVAVEKGKEYDVGEPTPEAVDLLADLEDLMAALEVLRSALFQGDVSLSTKSEVPEAVLSLRAAVRRAKAAGLKSDLSAAHRLIGNLRDLEDAVDANANATRHGQLLLNATGNKGMLRLRGAVEQLNGTVVRARELGLSDNSTTDEAVATLDGLTYVSHARFALHSAVKDAEALLLVTGTNRSDDEEERVSDALEPAIEWGQEVGLHRGLPIAKELLHRFESIEEAKESMNLAIATGNSSLQAKAGAGKAIKLLESAIKDCGEQNVTAGVALAGQYIKRLRLLQGARASLGDAVRLANESYVARDHYDKSLGSLQKAVTLAASAGLTDKSRIAGKQLRKLRNFAKADRELVDALQKPLHEPHQLKPVQLEDPQPEYPFNRTGLKPADLAQVEGAEDDGDDDFSEHIKPLEAAIQSAREDGLVDSSMKAQVETLRGKEQAFRMLRAASKEGDEALKSKHHIEGAISYLTAALQEAGESSLTSNVEHAAETLQQLSVIQPARDELNSAILHANVSMHTVSDMDEALTRLNEAIKTNANLDLTSNLPNAKRMVKRLLELKEAWVNLKAAVVQGQIALKMEQGEEQAISELQSAVDTADKVHLHTRISTAMDVLYKLMQMNAKKQQLQAAIDPGKSWS